ncbi:MAG: hypothetical protein PHD37_12540 [Gallionellaceae bacterium]|nr:hypothetical protein [Gallionellaceae bacterium]
MRMMQRIISLVSEKRIPWWLSQRLAKYHIEVLRRIHDRLIEATPCLVTNQDDLDFEIHALLGTRHVGMCLWAVKSFLHCAGKRYAVVLHDDGSLTDGDIAKLQRHLVGVRIFRKPEADSLIAPRVANYSHVFKYRFGQLGETDWGRRMSIFSLKLIDFNLLENASKVLVLDTDVLFFKRPDEIIAWIDDKNTRETLYCHEYYRPVLNANQSVVGFARKEEAPLGFNSGLICLDQGAFDLPVFEDWLEKNKERVDRVYTFEQHAYNHLVDCTSQHRALPETYSFNYNDADCIATHFGIKLFFFKNLGRVRRALKQV